MMRLDVEQRLPSVRPVPLSGARAFEAGEDLRPLRAPEGSDGIVHHFTVDVEEHFQVSALEHVVPRASWSTQESRVGDNVRRLLEVMDEARVRGTFFVLGWVAEREGALIRELANGGHEVASHGTEHQRVTTQTPAAFRQCVRDSRRLLEDVTGAPVIGFRAPSFSILPGMEWALDILLEEGYRYDSSLFPIRRPGYGYRGGRRDPHWIRRPAGWLAELPPTTHRWGGMSLPAAGGAYFRLLPYELTAAALRRCRGDGVPGTFYIHPWEVDPDQPRLGGSWATRFRHYGGLGRMAGRLERLFGDFRFRRIADLLDEAPAPEDSEAD